MAKRGFVDKLIILSLITILFYVGIILYSDIDQVFQKLSEFKFDFLPIIFSLMAIQLITLGIKFHRLLKSLGISLKLSESITIFIAGISLIATPGGAGTAIKSHIIKKKYGIPAATTLPIIFIERLTELVGILIILGVFFFWTGMYESLIAIVLGSLFATLMILLVSNNRTFESLKKIIVKIKKIRNLALSLDESKESLSKLLQKSTFFESLGWSIIAKFSQFAAVYFIFLSLNND